MRRALPVLLLLVVAVSCGHPAAAWKRVVLPNGLVVIAVEDRSAAVAGLHLAIRYDPFGIGAERTGIAALSQQSTQVQMSDLLKQEAWQDLGAQLRGTQASFIANTENDYCEFRAKITDGMLAQALQLLGKIALSPPQVEPEQLKIAREMLLLSQKGDANAVIEQTYYCFLRAYFGRRSPLAQPVTGTPEALKALSATDVSAFRATYMVPNNAVLTIIAPRQVTDLADLAKLAFGDAPAGKALTPAPAPAAPVSRRLSVAQYPGWRGVSVMLGVPAPAYGSAEFIRAQLVYSLLEGKGGRLQSDAALRGGLGVNRIAGRSEEPPTVTILPPMAQPRPFLILHMVMAPRQMEQARVELARQFEQLQQQPPAPAELDRAKQRLINSYARLRLNRVDLAKSLSCYELYGADPALDWQAEDRIQAVTAADITATAKQWFSSTAIGVLLPGDE